MRAWLAGLIIVSGCLSFPSSDEYASAVRATVAVDAGMGSVDAGAEAAAEPGSFVLTCPAGALLCESFENGSLPGVFASLGGAPTLSADEAHSPTHSLHAAVVAGVERASLETTVAVPVKVTFSFWFRASAPVPLEGYHVRVAHLLFGPSCDWDLSVEIWLEQAGLQLGIDTYDADTKPQCGPVNNNVYSLLPASLVFAPRWHRLIVDVDNTTQERRVTARVDEEDATGQSITSRRSAPPTTGTFAVGIPCVQTSAGCFDGASQQATYDVFVDDVTLVPK